MSLYDTTTPAISTNTVTPATPTTPVAPNAQATSVLSPTEAQRTLDTYGIDPNQVLTASNIQQTLTRPTAAPDDLLGIRSQINYDLKLPDEQNKLNDLKSQYYKAPSVIEGQRLNMGVLRGETGLAQDRLQAQINSQADTVNSLTAERDYRMNVAEKNIDFVKNLKLQYAGAKIGYGDSMDTIEKKLVKYQDQVKSDTKKETYKTKLMELGLKTSGSTKDLEKRLTKAGKNAKKQADEEYKLKIESAQAAIDNVRSEIAKSNSDNSSANEDVSKYFGGTVQTPSGGVSTNNPSAYTPYYSNYIK